jgi:hypothetical protein
MIESQSRGLRRRARSQRDGQRFLPTPLPPVRQNLEFSPPGEARDPDVAKRYLENN